MDIGRGGLFDICRLHHTSCRSVRLATAVLQCWYWCGRGHVGACKLFFYVLYTYPVYTANITMLELDAYIIVLYPVSTCMTTAS